MTKFLVAAAAAALMALPASAQEQQAGNAASTNAEDTFQQLIEKCDNTDVLVIRARIRLQLGRTTEAARQEAQGLLDQGLAECGEGKIDAATATLTNALSIAEAGATEKLGEDASVTTAADAAAQAEEAAAAETAAGQPAAKPWWQFW